MRIGVIGLGLIGQVVHLPNLSQTGRSFEVAHISDLSATLMEAVGASVPGTPRRSVDAMEVIADPDVDAVLLLTPGSHAPLAEAALLAGKHVLSEKPLCVSQAQADRLGALAAERRLVLQVAYMKAYDPSVPAARAATARIGDIRLVSVEVRHPTHESQIAKLEYSTATDGDLSVMQAAEDSEESESIVALGRVPIGIDRLYRGVLLGSVIHELSVLRGLGWLPPARWEHVHAWPFDPANGTAEPPSIAATAQLEGGALLRLQWLWVPDYPRYEETISVVGSAGAIDLDMPQPYGPNVAARLHVRDSEGRRVELEDGRHRRDSGFIEELRVFHAAVSLGAPVPTGAAEARADTASLQALTASIAARYGIELSGEAAALSHEAA